MAEPWTLARALAHLKARPPKVADAAIAERATKLLRTWGVENQRDRVSRPLVNMIRRGRARKAAGIKARAVWETLVAINAVPAVPAELLAAHAPTPARVADRAYYWRTKYKQLEAQLRGGRVVLEREVPEVPMLTDAMLKYFGLKKNPFFEEIESEKDVWWGTQHKEARSALIDAAERLAFVRLAGPRGSGKSLVGAAVKTELARRESVILVDPSPTISGVLSETHILTAVIQAIKRHLAAREELFPEAQSPSKRSLQMRFLLKQTKQAGRKVILFIDEAHELRAATFLALKRFLDEVDGIGRRLLGIVLIGQNPEAAYNPRARDLSEVTLRLQTVQMRPMNDEIAKYLAFKIERAGARVSDVITAAGLKAIAERCPYPLDANAMFASLLIKSFAENDKPIGRDEVIELAPAVGEE